ncbi:unannotated protein [freshwater metagenome]|uniref:Unannotated protein n=1 Tax=freshwater metagenome TaxID=449393 RepID=A0A6J6MPD2_9ZZZZ
MMTCCWRPTPASDKSSCTSRSRHSTPLIEYSLSPFRNNVRDTLISEKSSGSRPAELSSVRVTSARPSAARLFVPLKMTSSIFWLRTELGACAPNTHAMASTTLDLPEPFGPTTTVTPGSISRTVESAKDLKPLRVRDLRNTARTTVIDRHRVRGMACYFWQRGQKAVDLPPATTRAISAFPQVTHRLPSRPYTRCSA